MIGDFVLRSRDVQSQRHKFSQGMDEDSPYARARTHVFSDRQSDLIPFPREFVLVAGGRNHRLRATGNRCSSPQGFRFVARFVGSWFLAGTMQQERIRWVLVFLWIIYTDLILFDWHNGVGLNEVELDGVDVARCRHICKVDSRLDVTSDRKLKSKVSASWR